MADSVVRLNTFERIVFGMAALLGVVLLVVRLTTALLIPYLRYHR